MVVVNTMHFSVLVVEHLLDCGCNQIVQAASSVVQLRFITLRKLNF